MKRMVYAIKDLATQLYGQPIFVVTQAQAHRIFNDEINRPAPDNALYAHPEDYELHFLGHYDDETGLFDNQGLTVTVLLTRGKDASKPRQNI